MNRKNTVITSPVPKGLPALRAKRANHAELQPVSKKASSGRHGYVK